MPEYLAPGVYVEEIDTGSKPIEGVSTSTAGMIGVTERGPVDVPVLLTSIGEFNYWFGQDLNIQDYANNNGSDPHCYLPHAVEGFFTNGGKRMYLVRILDKGGALAAQGDLFDRTPPTNAAATVLLRTARELTGTAANPPALVVLDTFPVPAAPPDTWVRIGDGSTAEYHKVAATPAKDTTLVTLNFPLSRTHDSTGGVLVDPYAAPPPALPGLTLVGDAAAGATSIVVNGANASFATFGTLGTQILAIGGAANGEYRFITAVTGQVAVSATNSQATVQLDSPLVMSYKAGATVDLLILPAGPPNSAALSSASAGEALISVDDNSKFAHNMLVVVNNPAPTPLTDREVRRVGALAKATLALGSYSNYPVGTVVQSMSLADDQRSLTADATATDTTLTVDDATGIQPGQALLVGAPGPSQDTVLVLSVNTAKSTLTLTKQVGNPHKSPAPVIPAPKQLTLDAAAGASFLALDDRLGLTETDVLRVVSGPQDEFVIVKAIPGRAANPTAPDAGNVWLTAPLALAHLRANTQVIRQKPPTPAVGVNPTTTVLPLAMGDTGALLTDATGFTAASVARFTTGADNFYHRLSSAPTGATPQAVTLTNVLRRAHGLGSVVVGRSRLMLVQALDVGEWGNRLRVAVEDELPGLVSRTSLQTIDNATHIHLSSAVGVEPGTILELHDPVTDTLLGDPLKVASVDRSSNFTIILDGNGLSAAQQSAEAAAVLLGRHLRVQSREFRLTVYLLRQPDPALPSRNDTILDSEVFRYLSMDERHSRYVQKVIGDTDGTLRLWDRRPEGESRYIRVHDLAQDIIDPIKRTAALESPRPGPETLVDVLPSGRIRAARLALEDVPGDDSIATLTDATYIGTDDPNPELRTGLFSLQNIEEVSIVACPGRTGVPIQQALIDHCELMRYRFAVLDGPLPPNHDTLADVQSQRQQFDTKYAALYHPWLLIPDPFPANLARIADYPIPPSGHVVGIYARVDDERGVHKAPANEVVRGIRGLQRRINKGEQEILNPYPVNISVIRDFRRDDRGIRVFGARVITSDSDWKYVNVRRLLIFIEDSIDRGLQWVVFEPNAEPLWARVRRAIVNFLTLVWRNGALEGTKPEEAFFVKCDRTTMTQTDIDSGRLIVLVGVAPVKPAEFVIVRIGLSTAQADT
jgi:phage tail sheath protein FI